MMASELDLLYQSCRKKQEKIVRDFLKCTSKELLYQAIIDLGKCQNPIDSEAKTEVNLVPGCQSKMYLFSEYKEGKMYFQTESDALISAGLGVLLTSIYNDEPPEAILRCHPSCIEELGIGSSLTPGRANGLASLYRVMQQRALESFVGKKNS